MPAVVPGKTAPKPRKDPRPRRTSNMFDMSALVEHTKDPSRVYQFASPRAVHMGVKQREQLGWRIERNEPGGVQLQVGTTAKIGEPIELYDVVLMSIERDKWEEGQRVGWYGEGGQALVDEIAARVRAPRGGIDPVSRMPRIPGVLVKNLTDTEGAE